MSRQAFDAFKARLLNDHQLREEMEKTFGSSARVSIHDVVAFAKARGYDFDAADVPAERELADEQLDAVTGGTSEYRVKVRFPWLAG